MQGFLTEFSHTLRRLRGQIIGWGIGLALYGLLMGLLFDTIQTIVGLEEMMASYPPALMAFFGDMMTMNTPQPMHFHGWNQGTWPTSANHYFFTNHNYNGDTYSCLLYTSHFYLVGNNDSGVLKSILHVSRVQANEVATIETKDRST